MGLRGFPLPATVIRIGYEVANCNDGICWLYNLTNKIRRYEWLFSYHKGINRRKEDGVLTYL